MPQLIDEFIFVLVSYLLRVVERDGVERGHGVHHPVGEAEERLGPLPGLQATLVAGRGGIHLAEAILERAEADDHAALAMGQVQGRSGQKRKRGVNTGLLKLQRGYRT